jgi:hypothetical protein
MKQSIEKTCISVAFVNPIVPPCFLSLRHVFTVPPSRSCRTCLYYLLIIIGSPSGHDSETIEESEVSHEVSISMSKDPLKGG